MAGVVYVDVDDTLVRWAGTKAVPIPATIAWVKKLHADGAELYCWSAAGAAAAREVVEQLGIADLFVAFLPKPHVMLDDQAPSEWRGTTHVRPLDVIAGGGSSPPGSGDGRN